MTSAICEVVLVASLFGGLSNDDYATREDADAKLREFIDGWPSRYGPIVTALYAKTESSEARSRAYRILGGYRRWQADNYRPRGVPVWPLCDCYPLSSPDPWVLDGRDRSYLREREDQARREPLLIGGQGRERGMPIFYSYRRATELHVRGLLAAGTSAAEIDALLQRMWALERASHHDSGRDWIGGDEWRAFPREEMFSARPP